MSDVNKLDSKPCSFNPDQYKVKVTIANDTVAPVGSFPWAMIQMYLGKQVRRKVWSAGMVLGMITINDPSGNEVPSIQVFDAYGNSEWVSWQPGQNDMTFCDWDLVS
ncbi:Thoeris anti-defense Tad2 family protein [Xenorhabdus sp. KK7.4]|uniref:Thoeris anti-defense Tad2 family protein n=1 Tax=Xenorhabdus sp. KK7.4 TaxID=1851572 RepID=UPI000C042728|nr:MW1434 family type I TA system toxin [Xenorhabdus sp. KK7.4]PHM55190.1 hypothetical protein Xekk_02187 [Xenorhabdus sp. KK7.4]